MEQDHTTTKHWEDGLLTLHLLLLREHLTLMWSWSKVRQGMHAWAPIARRTSRSASGHHCSHHLSWLTCLRGPRSYNAGVHLLTHGYTWLLPASWHALIGMVTLSHRVSAMSHSGMSCHSPGMCSEWRSCSHNGHTGWFGGNISCLLTMFIHVPTDHTVAAALHRFLAEVGANKAKGSELQWSGSYLLMFSFCDYIFHLSEVNRCQLSD